jgi:hypothetical protein
MQTAEEAVFRPPSCGLFRGILPRRFIALGPKTEWGGKSGAKRSLAPALSSAPRRRSGRTSALPYPPSKVKQA